MAWNMATDEHGKPSITQVREYKPGLEIGSVVGAKRKEVTRAAP